VSAPALDLPRWAYLPGKTPAPDRAPLERAKALVPKAYENGVDPRDPAFRYGLALHDAGFFWEAHEVWEAVWKAAPKNGCDRLVLRALIQLANAGLKLRMGRPQAAARLVEEARGELAEAVRRGCAAEAGGLAAASLEDLMTTVAVSPDVVAPGPLAGLFRA
jgi:predicted metal-dependent hydrolase